MGEAEHERPGATTIALRTDSHTFTAGPAEMVEPPVMLRDRYVLAEPLGEGGLGVVYAAWDRELHRRIAVKLVRTRACGQRDAEREQVRILREAQALAQLSHPNVVAVYDVGTYEDGVGNLGVYLVMELVEGETLQRWVRSERAIEELVEVFVQAGEGLAAAHRSGLVHRDFKPANVMIDRTGTAKVVDFGLAFVADSLGDVTVSRSDQVDGPRASGGSRELSRVTRTGWVAGTPAYMAPEQFERGTVGPAADQFAFCQTFLEAVQGSPVFERSSFRGLHLAKRTARRLRPPRDPTPPRMRRALERGLDPDPDHRWPSMEALLSQLRRERARRWPVRVGGAALLVGAGMLIAALGAKSTENCRPPVWTTPAGAPIRAADLPQPVSQRLSQWDSAYAQTCREGVEGSLPPRLSDRRFSCLDRRRSELTKVLAHLDEPQGRPDDATAALADVGAVDVCLDDEALVADLPAPDPAIAAQVAEVREMLHEVDALSRTGKREVSEALRSRSYHRAHALGYGPLIAEVEFQRASAALSEARYAEAQTHFAEALRISEETAHARMAAEAAGGLIFVRGVAFQKFEEALELVPVAESWMARAGHPPRPHWRLLGAIGSIHTGMHRFDEALQYFERGLALQRDTPGADDGETSITLNNMATALQKRGDFEAAERLQREVLELRRRVLGPDHPRIATVLMNLGNNLGEQGKYDEAEEPLHRAVEILEGALGPDAPRLAQALTALGVVQKKLGHYDDAQRTYERALEIALEAFGPEHAQVSTTMRNLANVAKRQGEFERAHELATKAADLIERRLGPDHPELASVLTDLGTIERRLDRPAEARRRYERAVQIYRGQKEPNPVDEVLVLVNLGNLELELGDYEEAQRYHQAAMAACSEDCPDATVAYAQLGLGRDLEALGEPEEAIEALQAAIDRFESAGPAEHPTGLARASLSRALWAVGRRDDATAQAHIALEQLDKPLESATREELLAWMRTRRIPIQL